MEEAKALQQQQQQLLLQHQQKQLLLFHQMKQQQQHQAQQAAAISRFPSNIDAHLRPMRPIKPQQSPNLNPGPRPYAHANSNPIANVRQNPNLNHVQYQTQQSQQQQKNDGPVNQMELQMAYQDAWRVCHPDIKRPFSSLEDACERLLPYHVVADYEAEEEDRILDSDPTGQLLSRSQQWDNSVAAKVSEFVTAFENQANDLNRINSRRVSGEHRSEERMFLEQVLLQEECELKAEQESREKAGHEAHKAQLRMAAMAQVAEQQAWVDSHPHAKMMAPAPIRGSALASQGNNDMTEQGQGSNPGEMINGWENNAQKDEKEPSEDFLNDEEAENGDTGMQDSWRKAGEFDLNAR